MMTTDKTRKRLNFLFNSSLLYYGLLLAYVLVISILKVDNGKSLLFIFFLLASSIYFFYFFVRFVITDFYFLIKQKQLLLILMFILGSSPFLISVLIMTGHLTWIFKYFP